MPGLNWTTPTKRRTRCWSVPWASPPPPGSRAPSSSQTQRWPTFSPNTDDGARTTPASLPTCAPAPTRPTTSPTAPTGTSTATPTADPSDPTAPDPTGGTNPTAGPTGPLLPRPITHPVTYPADESALLPIQRDAAIRGDREASLTLVIFGDLTCPNTARFVRTIPQLERLYGDTLRVVFKYYPLPGRVGAMQAAEAIQLVGRTGEPLIGKLLMLDARCMAWQTVRYSRDESCAVCGKNQSNEQKEPANEIA